MKTTKSVLASPAKLRAIADRLERETREAVAELRRLADLGEGTAKVTLTATKAKKLKVKKVRKATAKKRAKVAKKRAKPATKRAAKAPAAKAKPAPKAAAPKKKAAKKRATKAKRAPLSNGHDHQAAR